MIRSNAENIDPICGIYLAEYSDCKTVEYSGSTFSFCSDFCADRFTADPQRFSGEPLIRLHNVWKIFKTGKTVTEVLRGVYLHIWDGDSVALIGASGSGKSTVLNIIGLLDLPTSGTIFFRGKDVSLLTEAERATFRSEMFGFVFQQYNLIPWLSAYDNVTLPSIFANRPVDEATIMARFEQVGIAHRLKHRPSELSGGEQQRVAMLRALVNNPKVIICDEPTGNLDSATGSKILDIIIDLHDREYKTFIMVTHDENIAKKAHQIITLRDGVSVRDHGHFKKLYTG